MNFTMLINKTNAKLNCSDNRSYLHFFFCFGIKLLAENLVAFLCSNLFWKESHDWLVFGIRKMSKVCEYNTKLYTRGSICDGEMAEIVYLKGNLSYREKEHRIFELDVH